MLFIFEEDEKQIDCYKVSESCFVPRREDIVKINDNNYIIRSVIIEFNKNYLYNIRKIEKITFKVYKF